MDRYSRLVIAHRRQSSVSHSTAHLADGAERRTVHFTGHVQGVGFRCTVQNISLNFDVRGFVKNLPNGEVLLAAEGPSAQLDEFVQLIQDRMARFIHGTNVESAPPTGEFAEFSIRH